MYTLTRYIRCSHNYKCTSNNKKSEFHISCSYIINEVVKRLICVGYNQKCMNSLLVQLIYVYIARAVTAHQVSSSRASAASTPDQEDFSMVLFTPSEAVNGVNMHTAFIV